MTKNVMTISPELLLAFVTVAEMRSFTLAARRLGLQQSTVSQYVKRLEMLLNRQLLARDTHSVSLTANGIALIERARDVLEANSRLQAALNGPSLHGHLRLGVSEDFAQSGLANVLTAFTQRHPTVDLTLTIGLSGVLYEGFDAGELDVIFVKRRRGDRRGEVVWREQLVWVGRPGFRPDPGTPLPLILYPPPSITRAVALAVLERAGRSWRVVCTSDSLSGIYAAAQAGLGVAPHSGLLVPPGLSSLAASRHLPELSEIEFVVIGPKAREEIADAVVDVILRSSPVKQQFTVVTSE